jgi:hypothetical protein
VGKSSAQTTEDVHFPKSRGNLVPTGSHQAHQSEWFVSDGDLASDRAGEHRKFLGDCSVSIVTDRPSFAAFDIEAEVL